MQHGSDQNLNYACAKIHDLVLDQHMRYKCPVPNSWLCVLIIIIAKIPKNCVRNYRKATY